MQPHRGTTVLVLGILGLVVCPICGIIAWVMGNGDIAKMQSGIMDPEGLSQTKAGKICGIIATILTIVFVIVYGIVIVVAVGAAATQGALQQ